MSDLLESALEYARMGFAVFPLAPRGKVPMTSDGFKSATTDEATIRNWWGRVPDANIGLATGAMSGGIVVIDVDADKEKGKSGLETLQKWRKENGRFPETCVARTGSGGLHYVYKDTEPHRSRAGIYPDIDVRGDGGYIVAPPSIHPNGTAYKWEISPKSKPPTPANGIIKKFLAGSKVVLTDQQTERFKLQEKIEAGKRVETLVRLVGSLVALNLSEDAIKDAVIRENETRVTPPLSMAELNREVFPTLSREWSTKKPYWEREIEPTAELPEPVRLDMLRSQFDGVPMREPIIDGVLRIGHKMIISAPSKAGKTWALVELAIAMAEGMNWCGMRCRQGKVLYLNMEVEAHSFYNRFDAVYKALGMNVGTHMENITVWNLRGVNQGLHDLTPAIISICEEGEYEAIIVDPLYKVLTGDENSNSDMRALCTLFDRIADRTCASVIYAHHYAKGYMGDRNSIDKGAGAGVFGRDPDAILSMSPLDVPEEQAEERSGWRLEFTLREFPNHAPVNMWFKFPLHQVDTTGYLDSREEYNPAKKRVEAYNEQQKEERLEKAKQALDHLPGRFQVKDFCDVSGISNRGRAAQILTEIGCRIVEESSGSKGATWSKSS